MSRVRLSVGVHNVLVGRRCMFKGFLSLSAKGQ